jgi:small-conductance mechanosensitive channel
VTALTPLSILLAASTPSPTPSCGGAEDFCRQVADLTGSDTIAQGSYLFLVKPLKILLIVVLAILLRFVLHRMINRLVRTTSGEKPLLLRPLREKKAAPVRSGAVAIPERRRQRVEALGSVLRSIASALVGLIAIMQILSELTIDLAPLLASAGIAGLAIGFGAQNLVKDFITGVFMLVEDQYGVGDVVDLGQAVGTVEAVGLRITTVRDGQGVVWYIRNGEIVRVGNKSQGWALVIVDVPVGFAGVDEAADILRRAAATLADDEDWADDLIEAPEVLGVEQITADGAVLRTTVKTSSEAQSRVGRELRRRLTEALDEAGIAARLGAGRVYLQNGDLGNGAGPGPAVPADVPADGNSNGARRTGTNRPQRRVDDAAPALPPANDAGDAAAAGAAGVVGGVALAAALGGTGASGSSAADDGTDSGDASTQATDTAEPDPADPTGQSGSEPADAEATGAAATPRPDAP